MSVPLPPTLAGRLPSFPWDSLAGAAQRARAHPGGIVDLSVGTPVDPVPEVVQAALAAAGNSPGYPATHGTAALREAAAAWLARRHGVLVSPDAVLPVIGTKELIAWLPTLLGCGAGDVVAYPALAYPTYDIGARLAGARPVRADAESLAARESLGAGDGPGDQDSLGSDGLGGDGLGRDGPGEAGSPGPGRVRLAWLNSPSNPTGAVLAPSVLRRAIRWAREHGTVLAGDECYLGLGWEAEPLSVLHPDVCEGSHASLLAVHSLSKRSNMAGYRAGFVTGDPALVAALLEVRKHAGLIVPTPVQAAMTAALSDDGHAERQRARYAARRARLRPALEAAGWQVEHSAAGLYLWATHPAHDGRGSVAVLAGAGILVAPGEFYGPAGARHIRVALTATDERVESAAGRLRELARVTG